MSMSPNVTMQQKRGLKANLPASAPAGQLLITTDTNELFVGTGTGIEQVGGGMVEHAVNYVLFNDGPNVYSNGWPGAIDHKGREGWYFTNQTTGDKINWYYYDPTQLTTTVANFKNAYAIITLDTNHIPFFGVYTQPTGTGDGASWFKSKRVYATTTTTAIPGTKYLIHFGTDPNVYPEIPRIVLSETGAQSVGAFAGTETVYLLALNTDSSVSAGNYKFVAHQLGFKTDAVNREFNLKVNLQQTITFTQSSASTNWTINHNLGKYPSVTLVDNTGAQIEGLITYNDANKITCEFSPAVSGKAYLN